MRVPAGPYRLVLAYADASAAREVRRRLRRGRRHGRSPRRRPITRRHQGRRCARRDQRCRSRAGIVVLAGQSRYGDHPCRSDGGSDLRSPTAASRRLTRARIGVGSRTAQRPQDRRLKTPAGASRSRKVRCWLWAGMDPANETSQQAQLRLSAGVRRGRWLASSVARCELQDASGSADLGSGERDGRGHAGRGSTRVRRVSKSFADRCRDRPHRPRPWSGSTRRVAGGWTPCHTHDASTMSASPSRTSTR